MRNYLLLLLALLFSSCTYEEIKKIEASDDSTIPVSFSTQIAPLLQTALAGNNRACTECHNDSGAAGGLSLGPNTTTASHTNVVAKVSSGNADGSTLYQRLLPSSSSQMPRNGPTYFTTEQTDLFKNWINQGALNN